MSFAQFTIAQDIVATRPGFIVKYDNCIVVYLILNSMLKNFENRSDIWLRYGQKYRGPFFDSQCNLFTIEMNGTFVNTLEPPEM
jgi:hypothetical protein